MALTSTEEAQTRELLAQNAALLSLASNETTITSKLGATKVNLGQLPAATAIADADVFLVRQGTTDKGVAGSAIKGYASPASSETVAGVAEIATQAETDAGTDNARIVTPLKIRNGFAINLTANGYIKFPSWLSGLTIQWGSFLTNTTADVAVTFPIAFGNAVRQITLGGQNAGAGVWAGFNSATLTGFSGNGWSASGTRAAVTTSYIVVGY